MTNREDLAKAATATAALLAEIRAGRLAASEATLHRLEGAHTVLELLAGGETSPDAIVARLEYDR